MTERVFIKAFPNLAKRVIAGEIHMSITHKFDSLINNKYVFQPHRFNAFIDYLKKENNQALELLLNETYGEGINLICLGILDRKDSTYIKALLDITRPDTTEKWFNVNAVQYGKTALHYAIYCYNDFRMNPTGNEADDKKDMENMKKIIEILLEAGADPMVKDSNGNTPIESACINRDTEIVELLKPKYSVDNLNELKFDVNTTCSGIFRRTASRMKRFFKGKSTPVNGGSKRKRKTKKSRRVKSMKKRK